MKIKKEYIVLVLVIAALVAYLYINRDDQVHYELPRLEEIDTKDITKIEIDGLGKSVALTQKDNTWYITPGDYPADSDKASEMAKVLGQIYVTDLVSESKTYERYDLTDKKRILVKAFIGDTPKRSLSIGKTSPTYKHTFIALDGDDRVYQAQGNFRNTFEVEIDEIRDKNVLSFSTKDITRLTINTDGKETTLSLGQKQGDEDEKAPVWKDESGKEAVKSAVDALLNKICSLKCDKFIDDKARDEMNGPVTTIIAGGIEEYSLFIYPKTDEDYTATSSQNDYVFTLGKYTVESIDKQIDKITKEPEESDKTE